MNNENCYSFCPKCNRLDYFRWDRTHCETCKAKYIDFPQIDELNYELINKRMREERNKFLQIEGRMNRK